MSEPVTRQRDRQQKKPQVQYVEKGSEQDQPRPERQERQERQERTDRPDRQERQDRPDRQPKEQTEEQRQKQEERKKKQEQQKEEKDQKYNDRKQKYKFDREAITVDTPIPELPKKLIEKPNREDLNKQLDKIDAEIDKLYNNYKKFKEDYIHQQQQLRENNKEKRQKEGRPIGQIIGEKSKLANEKKKLFFDLRDDNQTMKDQIEDLHNQAQKLRFQMKSLEDPESIFREISQLKDSIKNDRLSANQEKAIWARIYQLEKTVPFIEPLQEVEKKKKEIKIKQFVVGKQVQQAWQEWQDLEEEIKSLKSDYETLKGETTNATVKGDEDPILLEKRTQRDNAINNLKNKKTKLNEEFNKKWDEFDEQEALKRYVEKLTKRKDYLVREEKRRKIEEAKKAREERRAQQEKNKEEQENKEQEEVKTKDNPFKYKIELCEQLISFCHKLKPQQQQQVQNEKKQVDVEAALKQGEWKQEKGVYVLKPKEEREELLFNFTGGQNKKKKKGQQQKNQQQEQKPQEQLIQHDINTLQLFDEVRVKTPYYLSDLDAAIQNLIEKQKLFKEESDKIENENQQAEPEKQEIVQ